MWLPVATASKVPFFPNVTYGSLYQDHLEVVMGKPLIQHSISLSVVWGPAVSVSHAISLETQICSSHPSPLKVRGSSQCFTQASGGCHKCFSMRTTDRAGRTRPLKAARLGFEFWLDHIPPLWPWASSFALETGWEPEPRDENLLYLKVLYEKDYLEAALLSLLCYCGWLEWHLIWARWKSSN
jgi:hypothetical protein